VPSLRHELLLHAIPRVRRSRELDSEESERARLERCQADLDRSLRLPPGLRRRLELTTEQVGDTPVHTLVPRGGGGSGRSVLYVHGGGFVSGIDGAHVRYAARLATTYDAHVLLPDYPLTPTHTWRESHDDLVDLAARLAEAGPLVVAGDSAGGNIALAVALSLRGRGAAQPDALLLHAPWVDLTTSTPATSWFARRDPWLRESKLRVYARWWAGSEDDLARPEVSPALADLHDLSALPPTLLFCGTRDLLLPGCRLLVGRAEEAGWPLTYVEEPGLIHVFPLLPGVPEAARAWRTTTDFLAGRGWRAWT